MLIQRRVRGRIRVSLHPNPALRTGALPPSGGVRTPRCEEDRRLSPARKIGVCSEGQRREGPSIRDCGALLVSRSHILRTSQACPVQAHPRRFDRPLVFYAFPGVTPHSPAGDGLRLVLIFPEEKGFKPVPPSNQQPDRYVPMGKHRPLACGRNGHRRRSGGRLAC